MQTTTYHPEGNSLVGWFHHRLKDTLRACCTGPDWAEHLLGLRVTVHEDTTVSLLRPFSVLLCICLANCHKIPSWI